MKRYRISYCPIHDTEFCETGQTIFQNTIDHNPLSDECIARHRRTKAFIDATGLVQEIRFPSFAHTEIFEYLDVDLDHTSQWFMVLENDRKIPFYMIEPYHYRHKDTPGFCSIVLSEAIGPYGGGEFFPNIPYPSPTKSVLFTKIAYQKYLIRIEGLLTAAALQMPQWNSVSDEERESAYLRHSVRAGV